MCFYAINTKISKFFAKILTYLDKTDTINTLSRVGERSGLMTPQQPVNMQGANTAKAKALNDSVYIIDYYSLLKFSRDFLYILHYKRRKESKNKWKNTYSHQKV